MVSITRAPIARPCATNWSAAEPSGSRAGSGWSFGMFSKNQSAARLEASFRQL
jgi:hypothetical protein